MSQFLGQVLNCCKKENVDLANARIFQFPYYFEQARLRPIQIASHYLYPGYHEETLLAIKTFKFLELTNDGPILVFKSGDTGSYSYGNPYDLDTMTSSFKINVRSSPRRFGFRQSPGSIVNLPSIETVDVF